MDSGYIIHELKMPMNALLMRIILAIRWKFILMPMNTSAVLDLVLDLDQENQYSSSYLTMEFISNFGACYYLSPQPILQTNCGKKRM